MPYEDDILAECKREFKRLAKPYRTPTLRQQVGAVVNRKARQKSLPIREIWKDLYAIYAAAFGKDVYHYGKMLDNIEDAGRMSDLLRIAQSL